MPPTATREVEQPQQQQQHQQEGPSGDAKRCSLCAGCGTEHAAHVCSNCLSRYYCSRQCQTRHWSEEHRGECPVMALSNIQTRQLEIFTLVCNGEYARAEDSFQRLMPFAERVCQPMMDAHVQALASVTFDWGHLLGRLGQLHEADQQFIKGERLLEGSTKLHFLSLLCHGRALRSSVLRKLGRHYEALALLDDTVHWLRELSNLSLDVISQLRLALNERTLVLISLGRYEEAELTVRDSLSLFLRGLRSDVPVNAIAAFEVPEDAHHDVSSALSFLAELRRLQGDGRAAVMLLAKALSLVRRQQGHMNPLVVNSLRCLARKSEGVDMKDCIAVYDSAMEILKGGTTDAGAMFHLCTVLLSRAFVLRKAGNVEEADAALAEALEVGGEADRCQGPHPSLAEALCLLAERELEKGQPHAAANLFSRALSEFEGCDGGPDLPLTGNPRDRLDSLAQYEPTLRALGRSEEAARLEGTLAQLHEKEETMWRQALFEAREAVLQTSADGSGGYGALHGGASCCGVCERELWSRNDPPAVGPLECGHELHGPCFLAWQASLRRYLQCQVTRCPTCGPGPAAPAGSTMGLKTRAPTVPRSTGVSSSVDYQGQSRPVCPE